MGMRSDVATWAVHRLAERRIEKLKQPTTGFLGTIVEKITGPAVRYPEQAIETLESTKKEGATATASTSNTELTEPVVFNGITVNRKNLTECLQKAVPLSLVTKKDIPFTELERQGITINAVLMNYTLYDFADRVDPQRPWEQLVAMGLKYTHLMDKDKMPPELIASKLRPSPLEFLSLFVDPSIEKPTEKQSIEEKRAIVRGDTPYERFRRLNYTPQEIRAVGITEAHLVTYLNAPEELDWDQLILSQPDEVAAGKSIVAGVARIHRAIKKDSNIIV